MYLEAREGLFLQKATRLTSDILTIFNKCAKQAFWYEKPIYWDRLKGLEKQSMEDSFFVTKASELFFTFLQIPEMRSTSNFVENLNLDTCSYVLAKRTKMQSGDVTEYSNLELMWSNTAEIQVNASLDHLNNLISNGTQTSTITLKKNADASLGPEITESIEIFMIPASLFSENELVQKGWK